MRKNNSSYFSQNTRSRDLTNLHEVLRYLCVRVFFRYGGRHRTGWCKVEYSVESFNRKAQHDFLYGESRHLTRSELPKTDEWIRLKDGVSWELESEGEFNYKIVTDLASDMSALKFEDFLDGKDYCFIGSRYDFGLPSYKDVEVWELFSSTTRLKLYKKDGKPDCIRTRNLYES